MASPFLVIQQGIGCVEAWSTVRLPFEPRGWLVDFRAELRQALRAIAPAAGTAGSLAATYSSVDPFPVDAENVLIYNVGTAWFGRPSTLRIERAVRTPPSPPVPLTGPALHHHRYAVGEPMPVGVWRSTGVASEWDTGPSAIAGLLANAATVWAAVRAAQPVTLAPLHGAFGVDVTITAPDAAGRSLPGLTKAVLDGAIAALHDHDGSDLQAISMRVAAKARLEAPFVAAMLQPSGAAPGRRRLLHRFRDGVQWNPADDQCVTARLRLQPGDEWRVTGKLHSLGPADDPPGS